jgi:hypothetical protein
VTQRRNRSSVVTDDALDHGADIVGGQRPQTGSVAPLSAAVVVFGVRSRTLSPRAAAGRLMRGAAASDAEVRALAQAAAQRDGWARRRGAISRRRRIRTTWRQAGARCAPACRADRRRCLAADERSDRGA